MIRKSLSPRAQAVPAYAATPPPTISVIIINYNAGPLLVRALASVACQSLPATEIIVIDNGSSDGSVGRVAWSEFPTARLIKLDRNLGFAAASNLAARMARGTWLAMLNCDAAADSNWLNAMAEATRRNSTTPVFCSTQTKMDAPNLLDGAGDVFSVTGLAWRGGYNGASTQIPPEGRCFGACAAGAFIRRNVFLKLGGFEESFFCYLEDLDFSYRVHLAGYDCIYVPCARISHRGGASSSAQQDWPLRMSARNRMLLYLRNTPLALALVTWPFLLLGALVSLAQGARRGSPMAVLRGYLDVWPRLSETLAQRQALSPPWWPPHTLLVAMSWNPLAVLFRRPIVVPIRHPVPRRDMPR